MTALRALLAGGTLAAEPGADVTLELVERGLM